MEYNVIEERSPSASYAAVPSCFLATEMFDEPALNALRRCIPATATPISEPFWKDYDADPESHPTAWGESFDLRHWGFFAAFSSERRVGGAAVAHDEPRLELLEGRSDIAVLWDLRVEPPAQRGGVGTALLRSAERWAHRRDVRVMRIETQQINVPACRCYFSNGYRLAQINGGAYPGLPDEIQLLWEKALP